MRRDRRTVKAGHARAPPRLVIAARDTGADLEKSFGQLEIRATLRQMLRRVRWAVPSGYQMPFKLVPIARPRDGLPLTLTAL